MVKKVACFITAGFTECGAMTVFLEKINPACRYIQCFPNKPKYKKGLDPKYSGYSGASLLTEIYRRLQIANTKGEKFDVILIEDDRDARSSEKMLQYEQEALAKIKQAGYENIPVIFLFASPEIEAWFLADWDNSFRKVYRHSEDYAAGLSSNEIEYFCHRLKNYIDTEILKEHKNSIEQFGLDESGKYIKLSDRLIEAVSIGVKEAIESDNTVNKKLKEVICLNRGLYYSKRLHGDFMLRNISPNYVAEKCAMYYSKAYEQLRQL